MSIQGMRTKMSRYLKWLVLIIAATFAIGFVGMTLGGGGMGGRGANKQVGVLAKVNGQKIKWDYYLEILRRQMEQYERQNIPVTTEMEIQMRGSLFEQLVDQEMKLQAAKKERVRVSRGELNKKIDEYTDMQMKSLREAALRGKKVKDDKVFAAELAKAEPGMTIQKKRKEIRKQFEAVAEEIRKSLILEKLDKKIAEMAKTDDKAFEASFDQVNLSQITVASVGKRSDEQAKKRADDVAAKIRKGEDFAKVAGEFSDDMYKGFGGNRGPVVRIQLEEELRDPAFALKAGQVSDPIKTAGGYVILKSAGVSRNVPTELSDPAKKKQYREQFVQQEQERVKAEYYGKLRKAMALEIMDPEMKAYMAMRDSYAGMMTASESERKALIEKVAKLYQAAVDGAGEDTGMRARCSIQLWRLYEILSSSPMFGATDAEKKKYAKLGRTALEEALNSTEDVDLRLAHAKMALEAGDKAAALESLDIASVNAYDNVQAMEQIRDMYKQMNRNDLAAAQQAEIDDFKRNNPEGDSSTATTEPIRIPAGGE